MLSCWADESESQKRCVEIVYCGLSPDIAERTVCVILETYCDDSQTDELYIIAGYIAPLFDWQLCIPKWYHNLKDPPPRLGFYRTSDAIALQGQFERFDEPSRNQRIAALASVIPNGQNCFGVASWVSKQDFITYCSAAFHPAWHDPYYFCATYLIEHLCFDLVGLNPEQVDFFFDRQGKVGTYFKAVYDVALKPASLPLYPFMGDVRHENKEKFLPLQAADMQAGWVRRSQSTIQLWTNADVHLRQIPQKHYPVRRSFLERIERFSREHKDDIAAWAAEFTKWAERK
jgi:uncharacterized protein DUF3800